MRNWLAWTALVAGCNPSEDTPSYEADVAPLFDDGGCAACHVSSDTFPDGQGQLDLSSGWSAIVGVPSVEAPGMNLVEPGDHLYSYLWHKLNGSQSIAGGNGTNMPFGGQFSPDDLDVVTRWIDGGAPGAASDIEALAEQPALTVSTTTTNQE